VRAENAAGTSGSSATATVTTRDESAQDQTISFPAIGAQVTTNTVALAATASSGLAVTFAVESGPATISGGTTLTFTNAGTVNIVASQAGNGSWNPAPDVTNTFAVTKAAAGVALTNLAQTYNGAARTVTATTEPGGLTVDFTYAGHAWAPTNAGSYAVTGTVNEAMYQGSATGTLMVAKAAAIVTLTNLTHVYDGAPKNAAATTAPEGLTVEFTYDGSATAPSATGTYAVVATVVDANYDGSASGSMDIVQALSPFELWVRDEQGQNPGDSNFATNADYDNDGMTTWEEYLADTDPATNGSVFAITGRYYSTDRLIRLQFPASTNRFYRLECCTNLTNLSTSVSVSNLGWGVPGLVVTNAHHTTGTWYWVIRSGIDAP
jgi:hypothetical protein